MHYCTNKQIPGSTRNEVILRAHKRSVRRPATSDIFIDLQTVLTKARKDKELQRLFSHNISL